MKCGDARMFLAQVQSGGPVQANCGPTDLSYLSQTGYLNLLQQADYDKAKSDVATMQQLQSDIQNETSDVRRTQEMLSDQYQKSHSFSFHFEGGDRKQQEFQAMDEERTAIQRGQTDIQLKELRISELVQKKSMLDRMVPYGGQFVSITGQGVVALADLNVRNYRVSDTEFPDFLKEEQDTMAQLRGIALNANYYVSQLSSNVVLTNMTDRSQLWSVAIGLAKLQGDQIQIADRFLKALNLVWQFGSTIENRLMAAEIMTAFRATATPEVAASSSDLEPLAQSLKNIDHHIQHHGHVRGELAAGVGATILSGRKYDGTFPTDRFLQFNKMTKSYETAAILSVLNVPSDQLIARFQRFRELFSAWGYELSEDTELASAYLSISGFEADDVKTKMVILLEGLHNYLEYPIVAAAILASIPTLEANETLDLMEKAYSILLPYAGLERAETVSLAVRMIHGIKNEIVKQIDPTARLANTPVQFTYAPGWGIFIYHRPIIIAHSSYYSTFGGIGGAHPAHVHGYGGGGFGG